MEQWFTRRIHRWPQHDLYGFRLRNSDDSWGPYKFLKAPPVEAMVFEFTAALTTLGIKHGDRVMIFAENCLEWMLTVHACDKLGAIHVPLYNALGIPGTQHAFNETECEFIVLSPAFVNRFTEAVSDPSCEEARSKVRGICIINTVDYINACFDCL